MGSLAITGIGEIVDSYRLEQETRTAAEAVALAASLGANTQMLADLYNLDALTVDRDEHVVKVRVWRQGTVAQATAFDHRRTIDPVE